MAALGRPIMAFPSIYLSLQRFRKVNLRGPTGIPLPIGLKDRVPIDWFANQVFEGRSIMLLALRTAHC